MRARDKTTHEEECVEMTKLLEKAIAKVRELPEAEQDSVAVMLLSMTTDDPQIEAVDEETRAAILEGLDQARRGEFVPDAEIEALWKRHGV
jgi:predicted transcriptional regulator